MPALVPRKLDTRALVTSTKYVPYPAYIMELTELPTDYRYVSTTRREYFAWCRDILSHVLEVGTEVTDVYIPFAPPYATTNAIYPLTHHYPITMKQHEVETQMCGSPANPMAPVLSYGIHCGRSDTVVDPLHSALYTSVNERCEVKIDAMVETLVSNEPSSDVGNAIVKALKDLSNHVVVRYPAHDSEQRRFVWAYTLSQAINKVTSALVINAHELPRKNVPTPPPTIVTVETTKTNVEETDEGRYRVTLSLLTYEPTHITTYTRRRHVVAEVSNFTYR